MIELRLGDQVISLMNGGDPINGGASFPNFPVDYVYVISASVLDYSMNSESRRLEMNSMMVQLGIENPPEIITTWANAGDVSQEYIDKLPDALADAENKENVLFLFHGFGNDVSNSGPWPGGVSEFSERVSQLISSVKEAGHNVIWGSISYRTPDGSNPSSPYNERLLKPLLTDINPTAITGDSFVYDLYSLTIKHPEWIVSDGVHPDARGRQNIRFYTVQMLDRIMNGYNQPDPISAYYGRKFIFNLSRQDSFEQSFNGALKGPDSTSGASATDGTALTPRLFDVDGNPVEGPYMRALFSDINTAGASDSTNEEIGVLHRDVVSQSFFVNNQIEGSLTVHDVPNGLTGTMSISAAREATEPRLGDYTYRDETKVLDGAYSAGVTIPTASWRFTVENNQIRINFSTSEGSEYAYVNGWEIEFDDDPFRELDSDYQPADAGTLLVDGAEGASFDLLDTTKMFKDVEGQNPVTNYGDPVRRINSNTDGVYLVDTVTAATIVSYNGKPTVRLANNRFTLEGITPKYTRPVISHGTVDSPADSVLYWYNSDGSGYGGRKWGAIIREGQYRLFRNDGVINVVGVEEWRSYHNVYLNRISGQVTIDGSSTSYSSSDETYDDTDLGFALGGYPGSTTETYNGIVTHFTISDSELDQESLDNFVNNQKQYLDIS